MSLHQNADLLEQRLWRLQYRPRQMAYQGQQPGWKDLKVTFYPNSSFLEFGRTVPLISFADIKKNDKIKKYVILLRICALRQELQIRNSVQQKEITYEC